MMRIGIFGGGQLAQMLTQAAIGLGLETVIFERSPDSPAARLTQHTVVGPWANQQALASFAAQCDLVTLESEFVDASILVHLAAQNTIIFPSPTTVALVQDKLVQKERLAAAGLAVTPCCAVSSLTEALAAAETYGWPIMLKARRDGYDGYGNATLRSSADLDTAWARLSSGGRALMIEAFVPFERELAIMVVRGRAGQIRTYPLVETVQREHICHIVRAPAQVPPGIEITATALAVAAVEAVEGVGVFGVELFLLTGERVLINELAPRPHNSGHYTIEACVTSQFENHLRAVLGWPLGATTLRAPAAAMVNILGQYDGLAPSAPAQAALAVEGAHIHLYGKREVRRGRKMGHVTALGASVAEAEAIAMCAAELVEL